MIADLFNTNSRRSVKNADTILRNVHAINVYLTLLKIISIISILIFWSNKREEIQNIKKKMENKVLDYVMVYKLKIGINDTLLGISVTGIFT